MCATTADVLLHNITEAYMPIYFTFQDFLNLTALVQISYCRAQYI